MSIMYKLILIGKKYCRWDWWSQHACN